MTDKLKITQPILLIPFPLNKNEEKNKGKQNKQKHTKKCGKKPLKHVTGVTRGIKRAHGKL